MELHKQKEEFLKIVKKYNLDDKNKATKIATILTSGKTIKIEEFANQFKIKEDEAKIFLNFISKGIKYKEEHIDPNNQNKIN